LHPVPQGLRCLRENSTRQESVSWQNLIGAGRVPLDKVEGFVKGRDHLTGV
jgi:hypothetical protein